jgi:hypothetical protein
VKFNFDCLALVEIELWSDMEDTPDLNLSTVMIHGFFSTRRDMATYTRAGAIHDMKIAESHRRRWPWMPQKTRQRRYVVVPLSGVKCESLYELENRIEAAAKLIYSGVAA